MRARGPLPPCSLEVSQGLTGGLSPVKSEVLHPVSLDKKIIDPTKWQMETKRKWLNENRALQIGTFEGGEM